MSEIKPRISHLLKFYGPAGIDRISLMKQNLKNTIECLFPPEYYHGGTWAEDKIVASKEVYESFSGLSDWKLESVLSKTPYT